MNKEITAEVLQVASRWYSRLGAPTCSDEDKEDFERWLATDDRHAEAFAQVAATAAGVTHLARHDARLQALADAALKEGEPPLRAMPHWLAKVPLALAASLAVLIGVLRFAPEQGEGPVPAIVYNSAAHETRNIALSDGSRVQLDVGSEIRVQLTPDERAITLTSGRAFFQVAHDTARPFAVTAKQVRTVALGTEFQVQSQNDAVTVTLLTGSVRVSNAHRSQPAWQTRLEPGEQVRSAAADARPERGRVNAEAAVSWTRGRLVFESRPLGEVVAEINRYSSRPLRLGDPTLETLLIGGSFLTNDSAATAAAICAVLPLQAVVNRDEILLFHRHD